MRPTRSHATLDRGRSRDVSLVALARRASEERQSASRGRSGDQDSRWKHGYQSNRSSRLPSPAPSASSSTDGHCDLPLKLASASQVAVTHCMQDMAQTRGDSYDSGSSSAASQSSEVPSQHSAPYKPSRSRSQSPEEFHPSPVRSLQDQMQEAYALDNMHLARILYLRLQGIEVSSDTDPRIAEVRDEDFCFVPEGALVLNEECERAIREGERCARERWEKLQLERQMKEREKLWENEARRVKMEKLKAQRLKEEARFIKEAQHLEFKPRTQAQHAKVSSGARDYWRKPLNSRVEVAETRFQYDFMPTTSSSLPEARSPGASPGSGNLRRLRDSRASATSVPFKDVVSCMQGPLFAVVEPQTATRKQSLRQQDLLDTLLTAVEWKEGERRRAKGKDRQCVITQTWVENATHMSNAVACVACSVGTNSTMSRTNSWASSSSRDSASTMMTTPPSSPITDKLCLPPLAEDAEFRALVHSCHQKNNFTLVPLSSTPLISEEVQSSRRDDNDKRFSLKGPRDNRTGDALVERVRKSMSSLLDIAVKIQISYMRTVQFTIPSSPEPRIASSRPSPQPPVRLITFHPLKPEGYRARPCDVSIFAEPALNGILPAQVIPLVDPRSAPAPPRVFAPPTFVPPSPLRPRYVPVCPEWRMRPVANPAVLRLRALQNLLCARGMPWEGRAHSGSLGCGREKLTGVAFDGIGGSRLAFETRVDVV